MNTASLHQRQISVFGIGNVLLGDDGFGPLVIETFRCQYECGSGVEILDLGTPGLDIAPYLYDRETVVLVDAVHADQPPGTLCIYCEGDLMSHRAQLRLTAHDPGVLESIAHLKLAGHAPSELIIVGVVPESCDFGNGISRSILNAASAAVDTIARLLAERKVDCRHRPDPSQPKLWWLHRESTEAAGVKAEPLTETSYA